MTDLHVHASDISEFSKTSIKMLVNVRRARNDRAHAVEVSLSPTQVAQRSIRYEECAGWDKGEGDVEDEDIAMDSSLWRRV